MKKDKLGLFFLGEDQAYDFLQAEQSGEENGTTIDGKSDDESKHPVEIQLLQKEGDQGDGGKEKDDVEPKATVYFQLQDTFGKEILQKGRYGLDTQAGAGRTDSLETRYHYEVQQDIDDHSCRCHEVELFEATVGGEERAKNVGR